MFILIVGKLTTIENKSQFTPDIRIHYTYYISPDAGAGIRLNTKLLRGSLKINEILENSLEIIENHGKSLKIIENH